MALGVDGTSETVSDSGSSVESSPASNTPAPSSSGYSVTDPGYESPEVEADENALAELKAENTPAKSSKNPPAKAGDASGDEAAEEELDTASEDTESEDGETPAAETAAQDGISDELLDRAVELGYTLKELKRFRSEKSLEKEIVRAERLNSRLQARQKAEPPAASETPETPAAEAEPNWDELIEAGHDPDIVAMQKTTWQRAAAAEARLQQMEQTEQQRAWARHCERFDESLDKLGEEYESLLGKGRRQDLVVKAPEIAANRDKVFRKMESLRRAYEIGGETPPSDDDLIQEAVQASFWKHSKTIARNALKGDIKKAGSQALSRPHSTGRKELSGESLAAAKERDFWKKHS